jgi:Stress-induced bacterial acidophilic repeat motif.
MEEGKKRQGFASLSKERHREISSKGGKRSQELGTAHRFDKETGPIAGKKGGRPKKQVVTHDVINDNPDIK